MRPGRVAYTLIELLVAIAIIGVLAGLVLSAVQKVRSAAAKVSCANRVKQLALALHMTHDIDGHFPPGTETNRTANRYPYLSWRGRILPNLEMEPYWRTAESDYGLNRDPFQLFGGHDHSIRPVVLSVYSCPADGRLASAWDVPLIQGGTLRVSLSSYLGINGTTSRLRDGVLFPDSRVRIADIRDGASNTLFLGERPPSSDLRFGWWYAGAGSDGRGTLDSQLGVVETVGRTNPYPQCPFGPYSYGSGSGQINDPCQAFRFWSLHSGGANFAFADGRVTFLRYSVEPVMKQLSTRAGGEVIPSIE
jgi:prepilin-type N-terminal cleavage/methylation domain-containing protein/prepilin-type processing-associated H-X9-DG protein